MFLILINIYGSGYVIVCSFLNLRWDMTTEETPSKASKTLGATTPTAASSEASTTPGKIE